jgi:BON domain
MPRKRPSLVRPGAFLCAALLALPMAGCGLVGRSSPPLDRSQDERIRQEVTARLAGEPSLDGSTLRVEVNGGVVLLHGGVSGMGAWQCAVSTSGLVRGVRSVVDYLVIGRGPREVRCLAPRPDSAVIPGR